MNSQDGLPASTRKRKLQDDQEMPAAKRIKVEKHQALKQDDGSSLEDNLHHEYCVTKESMLVVKKQLVRLTKKNKEINASIQKMREAGFDELLSIMKTRKIIIDQLGRSDLPDELRKLCLETLPIRKSCMYSKECDLISVEDLLGGHEAVLKFAQSACQELEAKIDAFEGAVQRSGYPGVSLDDLPLMQALAKFTSRGSSCNLTLPGVPSARSRQNQSEIKICTEDGFALFSKLPVEVRLMIWKAGLPGPRVLTHDSKHNKRLSLLAVCTESRQVLRAQYVRFLSTGPKFPLIGSSVIYIDPDVDTIVRDLTCVSSGNVDASLFDLQGAAFNLECFRLLTGLAKVKHLALAFDVFHDNGGALFSQVQACCPDLLTLTLFPSSQLQGCRTLECFQHGSQLCHCQELRFVDFDSNFLDFQDFRWRRHRHRLTKRKAVPGLIRLASLPTQQYGIVFPEYVKQYGRDWKPIIKIGLLMQWNPKCQGWQTRFLEGDNYSIGFPGDDGETYRGFIESGIVCDANGELLSRYDGVRELFVEET